MNKFLRSVLALLSAIVLCFGVIGCKSDNKTDDNKKPPKPETITVTLSETSVTAVEDEIFTLTATVTPARTVKWSSGDDKIAAVSSVGRVVAQKAGQTTITAEADGVKATCNVTVTAASETDYYIVTDKEAYLTAVGTEEKKTIDVKLYKSENGEDSEVTGATVTFESLDNSIATVSASGEITPVAVGTTEIIVKANNETAYVTADVYTKAIKTPYDWLSMFEKDYQFDARYYLENDIDFIDVTYAVKDDEGNDKDFFNFSSEVNGNFHTVKNIVEWKDKRSDGQDAFQSIFGRELVGLHVKNISFKNIRFTKKKCAVFGDMYMKHKGTFNPNELYDGNISNVSVEAIFEQGGNALFDTVYAGHIENVFAYIRNADGSPINSDIPVVGSDYTGWGMGTNSFINVLVYADGGTKWVSYEGAKGLLVKDSYISSTRIDALYRASAMFDRSVWDISKDNLPELKGTL